MSSWAKQQGLKKVQIPHLSVKYDHNFYHNFTWEIYLTLFEFPVGVSLPANPKHYGNTEESIKLIKELFLILEMKESH